MLSVTKRLISLIELETGRCAARRGEAETAARRQNLPGDLRPVNHRGAMLRVTMVLLQTRCTSEDHSCASTDRTAPPWGPSPATFGERPPASSRYPIRPP